MHRDIVLLRLLYYDIFPQGGAADILDPDMLVHAVKIDSSRFESAELHRPPRASEAVRL